MNKNSTRFTATGLAAAALLHGVGALRTVEREVSPGLAETSLNLFHIPVHDWTQIDGAIAAAKSVLTDLEDSSVESDQIVAHATCVFLRTTYSESDEHDQLVADIDGAVPEMFRGWPGVSQAENKMAIELQGMTQPGAAHLYLQACHGE